MSLVSDLAGRVALVTGASRGIGRSIALALAEAGADVAVNYRSRADDAQAVLMVIGNAYMTGTTVQVNGGLHFN